MNPASARNRGARMIRRLAVIETKPVRARWAELALGVGGFGIGTGEFVIMGLLPNVAGNLDISVLSAGHLAIAPALQVRLMDVAEDAQTLAAALNHSAFNIANALGAWLAGVAVGAGLGWASTGWVGALLAVAGLLIFAVSVAQEGRNARSRALAESIVQPVSGPFRRTGSRRGAS